MAKSKARFNPRLPLRGRPAKTDSKKRKTTNPPDAPKEAEQPQENLPTWLGKTIIPIIVLAGLVYWLTRNIPTDFSAAIRPDRPVHIRYAGRSTARKSPACGCYFAYPDEWRGISFVSRRLALAVSSPDSGTRASYLISASFPSLIKPMSTGFRVGVQHVILSGTITDRDDLGRLVRGDAQGTGFRVLARRQVGAGPALTLLTSEPINVETLGELPIGAWIPGVNSETTLAGSTEPSIQRVITESFNRGIRTDVFPSNENEEDLNDAAFTIVDYLGPKLVVWSTGPMRVYGPNRYAVDVARPDVINAFILDVPFALRIAVGMSGEMPPGHMAQYRTSDLIGVFMPPLRNGEISGSLVQSGEPIDYDALSRTVRDEPTTTVCNSQLMSSFGRAECMGFRRPPLPWVEGFNIFGEVQQISFEGVEGTMMVGLRQIALSPSVPVEMSSVRTYDHPNGELAIPIQVGGDEIRLSRQFAAHATLRVNGEPVTRRLDRGNSTYDAVGLVVLVVGGLGWIRRRWHFLARKPG